MADRGQGTEVSSTTPANGNSLPAETARAVDQLEQRVTRLEDALSTLQDTSYLEDRLVERVIHRLDNGTRERSETNQLTADRARNLLPAAMSFIQDSSTSAASHAGQPWLLNDLYAEGRLIIRMLLDRRYRGTWFTRVVPLVLLIAIATSWIWLPGTSLLPTILMTIIDKTVDLLLAFCIFKILSREAHRYRVAIGENPSDASPSFR
jgi:hypothetical protein